MSKIAKDDIMKELGKAQYQGIKEAAKEQAKELGMVAGVTPGKPNPVVTSVLDQLAQQSTSVRLQIQRRDPVSGKMTYLKGPGEISAELIAAKGLHEIIDDWCGGGEYHIEIHAPGQERTTHLINVGGTPMDPGYKAKAAVAGGVPVASAYDPQNYFGPVPRYYAPPQDNSSNLMSKMLEMMMAKEMMASRMNAVIPSNAANQEVTELKAELARMREDQKRAEEERRRNEEMERLRREAAEDRKRSEEKFEKLLAEMNKSQTPAWVGLAQAALPAIAEFAKSKDGMLGVLSSTFGTVLQAQQAAAMQQSETFKMLMNRPTAADEISKMTSVFAQSQLTNLQTINQIVSSGLLDKGGSNPVVDLLSQLIDQGGQILQTAVGSKEGGIAGIREELGEPARILDAEVTDPPPLEEAHTAGALNPPQKQYDLNSDPSFRVIIEKIRSGANPREVALRLYRHGQPLKEDQGHPLAKAWCRDPKTYSETILRQVGGVSEGRIDQIIQALLDLAIWIHEGNDPEDFAQVDSRKRRKRAIPAVSPEMQGTMGYSFQGEATDDDDEDEDTEELEEPANEGDNGVAAPDMPPPQAEPPQAVQEA